MTEKDTRMDWSYASRRQSPSCDLKDLLADAARIVKDMAYRDDTLPNDFKISDIIAMARLLMELEHRERESREREVIHERLVELVQCGNGEKKC